MKPASHDPIRSFSRLAAWARLQFSHQHFEIQWMRYWVRINLVTQFFVLVRFGVSLGCKLQKCTVKCHDFTRKFIYLQNSVLVLITENTVYSFVSFIASWDPCIMPLRPPKKIVIQEEVFAMESCTIYGVDLSCVSFPCFGSFRFSPLLLNNLPPPPPRKQGR